MGDDFSIAKGGGSLVQFVRTPSHMKVKGNDMPDSPAEEGRLQHPNNKKQRSAEPQSSCGRTSGSAPCGQMYHPHLAGIHRAIGVGGSTVQCGGLTDSPPTRLGRRQMALYRMGRASPVLAARGLVQMLVIGSKSEKERDRDMQRHA